MLFIVNFFIVFLTVDCIEITDTSAGEYSQGLEDNDVSEDKLKCPLEPLMVPFFGYKCKTNEDCAVPGEVCCHERNWKICRRGKAKNAQRLSNPRRTFQLSRLQRVCPSRGAFFEILPTQNCTEDSDCGLWRICCPEGGNHYCRRAVPQLETIFSTQIAKTFNNMMSYLQCTPPPPAVFDFFAKPCKNTLDCLPNLCCQEKDRKVCRPSKRSFFPLFTYPT